jgi:hypothetical protein
MLAACGGMPKHNETRADELTTIVLTNLPAGATVSVDGRYVYGADDGVLSIPVQAGMHAVEVRMGPAIIYKRDVFLDDGTTREITVND